MELIKYTPEELRVVEARLDEIVARLTTTPMVSPPGLSESELRKWTYRTPRYLDLIKAVRERELLLPKMRSDKKIQWLGSLCQGIFAYHEKFGGDAEIYTLALRVAQACQGRLIARMFERKAERAARAAKGTENKQLKKKQRRERENARDRQRRAAQKAADPEGHRAYLRAQREKNAAWKAADPEGYRAYLRARREKRVAREAADPEGHRDHLREDREHYAAWKAADPEGHRAYLRAQRERYATQHAADPEGCREYSRKRRAAQKAADPEGYRARRRTYDRAYNARKKILAQTGPNGTNPPNRPGAAR